MFLNKIFGNHTGLTATNAKTTYFAGTSHALPSSSLMRDVRLLSECFSASHKSRDSSVGIALGYGLDDRGSRVRLPAGAGNSSLHHRVQNGSGAHPVSHPMGTRGSFLGVKRLGREADHSPPSSAEVKECVELYLHYPIRLHGVVLS
jgi:hypothetical protein